MAPRSQRTRSASASGPTLCRHGPLRQACEMLLISFCVAGLQGNDSAAVSLRGRRVTSAIPPGHRGPPPAKRAPPGTAAGSTAPAAGSTLPGPGAACRPLSPRPRLPGRGARALLPPWSPPVPLLQAGPPGVRGQELPPENLPTLPGASTEGLPASSGGSSHLLFLPSVCPSGSLRSVHPDHLPHSRRPPTSPLSPFCSGPDGACASQGYDGAARPPRPTMSPPQNSECPLAP